MRGWGGWTLLGAMLITLPAQVSRADTTSEKKTIYRYMNARGDPVFVDDLEKVPARYRHSVKRIREVRAGKRVRVVPARVRQAPAATAPRRQTGPPSAEKLPTWLRILLGVGLGTVVFGLLLWLSLKIIAPGCGQNSLGLALFIGIFFALTAVLVGNSHPAFLALPVVALLYVLIGPYELGLARSLLTMVLMGVLEYALNRLLPAAIEKISSAF